MDPDLRARFFIDSDAEPLTLLLNDAYSELAEEGLNFTAATQGVSATADRVSAGVCWVVERGADIVASLMFVAPPGDEVRALTAEAAVAHRVWLEQVAVSPAFRGRQVARQLFDTACGWARDAGYTSVGLDTAEPASHLVRMYEKWGFRRAGTVHFRGKTYESAVLVKSLVDI